MLINIISSASWTLHYSAVKAALNLTLSLSLCWAGCRQYGFFSYMKDLFQCPDSVMAYLCVLYNVHRIPVGDDSARRHVEEVIHEHPEVRQFYTCLLYTSPSPRD